MERIGSTDAKGRFGEILRRARSGETFIITQKGEEAARLVPPAGPGGRRMTVDEAVRTIRALRPTRPLRKSELRALIEEGRRF